MEQVTKANLNHGNKKALYNVDYEDIYHSKGGGLAETKHVFHDGNRLPFCWKNRHIFTIGETGFGTGLNFLTTWQAWQETPDRCTQLHYISIEKHPLSAQTLSEALADWPELHSYARAMITHYPPALTGIHRINLAGGNVKLTLCFMDVATALDELSMAADCWFLDGFAPSKNPAMWSQEVMHKLAKLSRPGTTLATYTAAGQVRRNLQAAGWTIKKCPGFGVKREMLTASLAQAPQTTSKSAPWYALPQATQLSSTANNKPTATIIGGGIAGCQVAYALAQRHWKIHLIERHTKLAQEASGNPAGIISPKMTAKPGWGERFYRQAFLYTLQQLKQLEDAGHSPGWDACGSLQMNHSDREQQRWHTLRARNLPAEFIQFPDATQASILAGIDLKYGGSFFPTAGWIQPQRFCAALVQHPNISVSTETAALSFTYDDGYYRVTNTANQTLASSDTLIISNGRDTHSLLTDEYLPLMAVHGQTSTALANHDSKHLRITLGHEGYLTPAINDQHVFGATFERGIDEPNMTTAANTTNQQQLQKYLPTFGAGLTDINSGHAAIRMTTPDRYPYCGPLPNEHFYHQSYNDLHYGRKHQQYPAASYQPKLFIASGFGSRGLTTSALAAELLAALINGEPFPLEKSLYYALHPARFLIKQLKTKTAKPL